METKKLSHIFKRLDKKDIRFLLNGIIPVLFFLATFFYFDHLIYPSIAVFIITFIMTYFWDFFKGIVTLSLFSTISLILLSIMFLSVIWLTLKYTNGGEVSWNISIVDMLGLNRFF
ncbi:MAG: hypothetical protein ACK4IX_13545 [Candidatus Sericytochromatia bacterium]